MSAGWWQDVTQLCIAVFSSSALFDSELKLWNAAFFLHVHLCRINECFEQSAHHFV